jgi:hypothetical protein
MVNYILYIFTLSNIFFIVTIHQAIRVHRGRDRIIVGITTTYAISAYHHSRCEFESRWGEVYSIHHYVIKFVNDMRHINGFLLALRFVPSIKLTTMI